MTAYATLDELKSALSDVVSGPNYDALLTALLDRASRFVDAFLGYEAGAFAASTSSARYFDGDGSTVVYIPPCIAISEVAVKSSRTASDYTAWTASDWLAGAGSPQTPDWNAGYYTFLVTAPGTSRVFTAGEKTVRVTGVWGRTASVPAVIKQCTIILAAKWFKRGQQAYADQPADTAMGIVTLRQDLDTDVRALLVGSGYYRRGVP